MSNNTARALLEGAIDLHFHGYPEITFDTTSTYSDIENLEMAKKAGVRGIVVKSHFWPTIDKVFYLKKMVEGIDIFSSITLNPLVGGVHGYVAEAAAKQGARVVWLPTWQSSYDLEKNGMCRFMESKVPHMPHMGAEEGITLCKDGKLIEGVMEVFDVAKEYALVIGTGHISPMEALAVSKEAKAQGFKKLIFTHPLVPAPGAQMELMKEFVKNGGLIEFTFLPTMPHRQKVRVDNIAKAIQELGAENCVMSSDCFYTWSPYEYEMLLLFISCMLENGIPEDSIRTMIAENPERMLYM